MASLDQLLHLLNFFYPAFALGALLALVGWVFSRNRSLAPVFVVQAAINTVAGGVALLLGLWLFGRDGKMATYGALVVACASSQCWVRLGAGRARGR